MRYRLSRICSTCLSPNARRLLMNCEIIECDLTPQFVPLVEQKLSTFPNSRICVGYFLILYFFYSVQKNYFCCLSFLFLFDELLFDIPFIFSLLLVMSNSQFPFSIFIRYFECFFILHLGLPFLYLKFTQVNLPLIILVLPAIIVLFQVYSRKIKAAIQNQRKDFAFLIAEFKVNIFNQKY